jgi:CHAT domain-containing protein
MAIEQAGQALYRTLIAPVEVNLAEAKHLIIAPDGALQVLPFEALIRPASRQGAAGGGAASSSELRWLVQDFSISETPSISTLAAIAAEALDQYRYLHFAARASIDDTRPGRSGIVLSSDPASREDGMLRADEVMALHLNADLVTLSACSTGLGKVLRGEGIVGLTRAFVFAGARSVAASLRNAKLSLAGSSDRHLRDPYYWAPFVLVGLAK